MTARTDLIARLKAATEGSRELDLRVRLLVDPQDHDPPCGAAIEWSGEEYVIIYDDGSRGYMGGHCAPHYTESIDDALTLVPEDPANPGKQMLWSVSYDEDGVGGERSYTASLGKGYHDPAYIYGHSKYTPALALTIAALEAEETLTTRFPS